MFPHKKICTITPKEVLIMRSRHCQGIPDHEKIKEEEDTGETGMCACM